MVASILKFERMWSIRGRGISVSHRTPRMMQREARTRMGAVMLRGIGLPPFAAPDVTLGAASAGLSVPPCPAKYI